MEVRTHSLAEMCGLEVSAVVRQEDGTLTITFETPGEESGLWRVDITEKRVEGYFNREDESGEFSAVEVLQESPPCAFYVQGWDAQGRKRCERGPFATAEEAERFAETARTDASFRQRHGIPPEVVFLRIKQEKGR